MKRTMEHLEEEVQKKKKELSECVYLLWTHPDMQKKRVDALKEAIVKEYKEPMECPLDGWTLQDAWCETSRDTMEWTHGECGSIECTLSFLFAKEGETLLKTRTYEVCRARDHWGTSAYEDLDIVTPLDEVARGSEKKSYLAALGLDPPPEDLRLERAFAAFYICLYGYHTNKPPTEMEKQFEKVDP